MDESTTLLITIGALIVALAALGGCLWLIRENELLKRDNLELRGQVQALFSVVENHYPNELAQALQAAN